jgi:hypothetical protein
MKTSVWNAWNYIKKVNPQQTGFGALYASSGYTKHAQYIHKCAVWGRREKRKRREANINVM